MDKADRALSSASALIELGDVDGACNRAYYAMFDTAKAALAVLAPSMADASRTHSGLITAFSQQLVKDGPIPKDIGRLLKRAEETRLVADYRGDSVEPADAKALIVDAETFVAAVRKIIGL